MTVFGTGPTLRDASKWLRDPAERHRRILDVAERNSVIEGLPRFTPETRARLLDELRRLSSPAPGSAPRE